jgi:hypothetical protein
VHIASKDGSSYPDYFSFPATKKKKNNKKDRNDITYILLKVTLISQNHTLTLRNLANDVAPSCGFVSFGQMQ